MFKTLFVSALFALAGHAETVQVPWDGLPTLVYGKTVRMVVPGGPVVTGKVTAVESDALALRVTRTSDSKACPKGSLRVARARLRTLEVESKGTVWRVIGTLGGTALGFVGGAGIAIAIDWNDNRNGAATAAFTGALAAGAVAGYFAGNSADRKWTVVQIVADR